MKRKLSFIEQFDRTLSGGFLKQITWLTIFTLMILAVLVGISLLFPEGDQIFGCLELETEEENVCLL